MDGDQDNFVGFFGESFVRNDPDNVSEKEGGLDLMNRDSLNLAGRRAVVTGSSRGIRAAIAVALAEAGADVLVYGPTNRPAAEGVAAGIQALGRRTAVVLADLSQPGSPGGFPR